MTYYVRAYATNETGTSYGQQISITTRDGLPVVETKEATSTATTIAITGEVTETWGYSVTERGFVYSQQNTQPTTDDLKITTGKGIGVFNFTIQNLEPESQYYVRAYAVNENGTSYGRTIKVTTKDGLPYVVTSEITASGGSIITGGNVISDGGFPILKRGVCYGSFPYPDTSSTYTHTEDGQGIGYYTSNLGSSLSDIIYVRAYATNTNGTSYGEQVFVHVSYLMLPSFMYNGHTYKVAPASNVAMSHITADNYCNGLEIYGFSDWFMPSLEILRQMYILKESIGCSNLKYWATPELSYSGYYINPIMDFSNGTVYSSAIGETAYVLPIRIDK